MDTNRQRNPIPLISIGITAFLVGTVVGGLTIWRALQDQMRAPEIVQSLGNSDSKRNPERPAALVRVATAEWKSVQPLKPIIGRLVEVRKVTVASEVDGQVVEMPVEEGAPVVGGETILARVDDVWNRLALERGRSRAASIQAKSGYASAEARRLEQLDEKNVVTESELDGKRALAEELEAELAEALTTVREEEERRTRSVIRAPFDGTIIAKHTELGERLSPGTPVVDIVSCGTMFPAERSTLELWPRICDRPSRHRPGIAGTDRSFGRNTIGQSRVDNALRRVRIAIVSSASSPGRSRRSVESRDERDRDGGDRSERARVGRFQGCCPRAS